MTFGRSFTLRSAKGCVLPFLFSAASSFALNYDVVYTPTAPTVDGTADAVWASASPAATGFVDAIATGTVSAQQTDVRLLWDSSKLYLLIEAEDNNTSAPASGNDAGFNFGASSQDTAEIFLDPGFAQTAAHMYHIAVNPAPNAAYTYTEAGQNGTTWNLSPDSTVAVTTSPAGWTVEMALAWTDFNNTVLPESSGIVLGAPANGTIWGAQFGRLHDGDVPNNTPYSKWQPTSGAFRQKPLGTLTFIGGPASVPTPIDLSDKVKLYSTSFEAPAYTAGQTIAGLESWVSGVPTTFVANDTVALTGTQSLEIKPVNQSTLTNAAAANNAERAQYLQYALRLPSESGAGYRHVLYLHGYYGGTGTNLFGQIWIQGNSGTGANLIEVYTYESEVETALTRARFVGAQIFNEWAYVTLRVDPIANTFEVWYNGTKLARPGLDHFKAQNRSTFTGLAHTIHYAKSFGTESVYVDDFARYIDPVPAAASDWQLFE